MELLKDWLISVIGTYDITSGVWYDVPWMFACAFLLIVLIGFFYIVGKLLGGLFRW